MRKENDNIQMYKVCAGILIQTWMKSENEATVVEIEWDTVTALLRRMEAALEFWVGKLKAEDGKNDLFSVMTISEHICVISRVSEKLMEAAKSQINETTVTVAFDKDELEEYRYECEQLGV